MTPTGNSLQFLPEMKINSDAGDVYPPSARAVVSVTLPLFAAQFNRPDPGPGRFFRRHPAEGSVRPPPTIW
jgi:hypothetical protein